MAAVAKENSMVTLTELTKSTNPVSATSRVAEQIAREMSAIQASNPMLTELDRQAQRLRELEGSVSAQRALHRMRDAARPIIEAIDQVKMFRTQTVLPRLPCNEASLLKGVHNGLPWLPNLLPLAPERLASKDLLDLPMRKVRDRDQDERFDNLTHALQTHNAVLEAEIRRLRESAARDARRIRQDARRRAEAKDRTKWFGWLVSAVLGAAANAIFA